MEPFIRFARVALLLTGLLWSCGKAKDAAPEIPVDVWIRANLTRSWNEYLNTTGDNHPFVGSRVGISRHSFQYAQPQAEYSRPLRLDSTWATLLPGTPNGLIRDTTFHLRCKKGERLYFTVATPWFQPVNSAGNYFTGSLLCDMVATMPLDNGQWKNLANLFSRGFVVSGGPRSPNNEPVIQYMASAGRQWVVTESSFVIP